MKRVALFLVTNLAVMLTLSVVASVLGLHGFASAQGLDPVGLLGFAMVFGFGGAIISLLMSKWSARMATGARPIVTPASATEAWLVNTVSRQAAAAGIGMPEVAIYESDDINAFATGWNRNKALVAVSTGLLRQMTQDEAEAVLGHEITHVANGDMITLALVQGVVNTFVIVIARAVGWFVDRVIFKQEGGPGAAYYVTFFVLEIGLGILASCVVAWFSRQREFRADVGGARLSTRPKMIAALVRLQDAQATSQLPGSLAAFGLSGSGKQGWLRWFSTHPPLELRIAALRAAQQ